MAIVYLDVDDEITSAAARIRSAQEVDIAIVLPAGSRIATSRINFRLLAREASSHSRRLAIVAPEASARALAASAGLPVFASVVEFEAVRHGDAGAGSAATGDEPRAPTSPSEPGAGVAFGGAGGLGAQGAPGDEPGPSSGPTIIAPPSMAAGVPRGAADASRPASWRPTTGDHGRSRGALGASTGLAAGPASAVAGRRRWPLVLAALLIVAIVGTTGAVAGYVLLPTATITLQLTTEPVGPLTFTGTADPDSVSVDAGTATIPAVRVAIALSATGTFEATGTRVEEAPATGTVQWQNCDPSRAYTIPGGTLVRTAAGVGFTTQDAILVPVAIISGTPPNLRVRCQVRNVEVRAVRTGPGGNVPKGAIRVVPGAYDPQLVLVTNPSATSGGVREEFPKVAEKDVVAAIAALTAQLDAQLQGVAPNPPGLPAGAIAHPETATRGEPVASEVAADIVGREVETFDLELTARGDVVAADPGPLREIGLARVAAEVPDGMTLREGSAQVDVGPGVVAGTTVRYPVEARAEAVRSISVDELRTLVKGKTPSAATDLLEEYGTLSVEIWPSWAGTITGIDARLSVAVEGVPPAQPSAEPTAPPNVAPPTAPNGAPTPSALPTTASPAVPPSPSDGPAASEVPAESPPGASAAPSPAAAR